MPRASNGRGSPTETLIALWILAAVAALFFLRAASQLLIPIVLAVLISYALEPIVAWLVRHRVPRAAGTSAVMLTILALGAWGAYSLRDNVLEALDMLPQAAKRAREMVMSSGSGPGANIQQAADELRGATSERGSNSRQSGPGSGTAQQGESTSGVSGFVQRAAGSIVALAGHLVVIFFLVFFLLLSGSHVKNRLVEISGPQADRRRIMAAIVDDINAQIQRYLLVLLVTAVVVGVVTWGMLAIMGVRNAPVWGILAGVFNSIPYFGPVIVSGGLFVVGIVQGGGATQALQMAGVSLIITSLEGWLLTPALMGKAERMSALTVFLGLLLWTWLWGAWGTVLAVPMLVVLKSVADRIEPLRPIGRLMAP